MLTDTLCLSNRALSVRYTRTESGQPLALVTGLPGDYAEMTPVCLRELAVALMDIAQQAEAQTAPKGRTHFTKTIAWEQRP